MPEKMPENLNLKEDILYEERRNFIIENYPIFESSFDFDHLVASGLDGKEVLEKRDNSDELEAILTYKTYKDENNIDYYSIGIILTREESRREGLMKELINELKELPNEKKCEYMIAGPDTPKGKEILPYLGFDVVDGQEYLRLDLE